ncbi:MAG: acetyltransferase [Elainella sp.]
MLLKNNQTSTETLIEIVDVDTLINPLSETVPGRIQNGQEEQEPEQFAKTELVFPSGEALPKCWFDANYKLHQPAGS